jgi:hypothetical protein
VWVRLKSFEILRQSIGVQLQSSRTIKLSGLSSPSRTHYTLPKGRLLFTTRKGRTTKELQSSAAKLCEPKISDDYAYIFKSLHICSAKNIRTYFLTYLHHEAESTPWSRVYIMKQSLHHGAESTSWSRVLLEKLKVFQLVEKFPSFYGTRRFITAVTSARHLSLSLASSIHPTSHVRRSS